MPCYYTGSAEGDRALAAEEAITKNLTPLITELTEMLCEVCSELFREPESQHSISQRNVSEKVHRWWKEHQKIDEKRKTKGKR